MRTQANLDALCEELSRNCGDLFAACKSVSLSPSFVRKWMKEDEQVRGEIENAQQVGALALETEAIRRAVHGVEQGVYYQGDLVATETKYSDKLLETVLKANLKHKYGAEATNAVQVNLTNQIQIMPRANSYEEWLAYTQAKPAALPGGVVDAEFTPVLPAPHEDPAMADIL